MKKLIVLSVVFALVAGAAFAEINVGGGVQAKVVPLQGDNGKDALGDATPVTASANMNQLRVEASGQDDDGVFGGYVRLDHAPWWASVGAPVVSADGYVWWKPIDQFKFTIGNNGHDGFFGADGIARWNFYQVAADVGVASEGWAYGDAFYAGFADGGGILTITPIDDLEINIAVPFFKGGEAKDIYAQTNAQVAYNIGGVGRFALSYAGNLGDNAWLDLDPTTFSFGGNGSKVFAYFGLSAIENLGVDIGLGLTFPVSKDDVTYNAPLAVGLGLKFDSGAFGIKVRFQGKLGESITAPGGFEYKGNTVIDADVLPYFAVSDKVSAFLSAGLKITSPGDNDYGSAGKPDSVTSWHINPYIAIKSNWWAPNFYAGIRIDSDGVKGSSGDGDASKINWSVPIGIAFGF